MGVGAALGVLLLFITTAEAETGGVTFWRTEFTMTCPESGKWNNDTSNTERFTHTVEYKKKGIHYCVYGASETKYYFYVQGKVCDNCYELDSLVFGFVIVVDVVLTTMMMIVIYRCTKKRSADRHAGASKAPTRSGGRAPPVPSPDYEQLNLHTRSQDTYSVMNKMG